MAPIDPRVSFQVMAGIGTIEFSSLAMPFVPGVVGAAVGSGIVARPLVEIPVQADRFVQQSLADEPYAVRSRWGAAQVETSHRNAPRGEASLEVTIPRVQQYPGDSFSLTMGSFALKPGEENRRLEARLRYQSSATPTPFVAHQFASVGVECHGDEIAMTNAARLNAMAIGAGTDLIHTVAASRAVSGDPLWKRISHSIQGGTVTPVTAHFIASLLAAELFVSTAGAPMILRIGDPPRGEADPGQELDFRGDGLFGLPPGTNLQAYAGTRVLFESAKEGYGFDPDFGVLRPMPLAAVHYIPPHGRSMAFGEALQDEPVLDILQHVTVSPDASGVFSPTVAHLLRGIAKMRPDAFPLHGG
jgi:hypothetical protein